MATILGIWGSLRKGSYNESLLRAAVDVAPAGCKVETASIRGIPLYDADVQEQGFPAPVTALKERVVAADGLLLVTPEYNHSLPGVFKNAIDWLSRPSDDIPRVFKGRPVAIMGASPGRGGTMLSQEAWLPVLRTLGMRPWFGASLHVALAGDVFDDAGRLIDDDVGRRLAKFMAGFAEFVGS